MKCHILFSEKNKKNISKCRLLKILPRVLSVNFLLYLCVPDLNSLIELWIDLKLIPIFLIYPFLSFSPYSLHSFFFVYFFM